jgi:hypothetical protein
MTRLTTLIEIALGILVVVLGIQAPIWMNLVRLNGQVAQMGVQVSQINSKIDQLNRQ